MHRRLATFAHSRRLVTLGLASVWCLSGFKERRKECRGDSKRCVKESNIFLHSQKRVQKNVTRFFDIKKCQKIAWGLRFWKTSKFWKPKTLIFRVFGDIFWLRRIPRGILTSQNMWDTSYFECRNMTVSHIRRLNWVSVSRGSLKVGGIPYIYIYARGYVKPRKTQISEKSVSETVTLGCRST